MDAASPDLERFRAVAILHEGRWRDVVLLEDRQTQAVFAGHHLKVDAVPGRFEAGVGRLQPLRHPRLAALHEALPRDGGWLLFDYVEGQPVAQYHEDHVRLPADLVSWWLVQILQLLQYLHAQEIVVGGFSPADLLVTEAGIHLVDPGYFLWMLPQEAALSRSPLRRSVTAPEHRASAGSSVAGDLYSAGAVAFWMLTGAGPGSTEARPRNRATRLDLRDREGRAAHLVERRMDLRREVALAIAHMIQFSPSQRSESATEVLAELGRTISQLSLKPLPPPATLHVPRLLADRRPAPLLGTSPSPTAPAVSPPPLASDVVPDVGVPSRLAHQEFVEDLSWTIRHNLALQGVVVCAALLLLWLGSRWLQPRRPLPPPILTVATGRLLRRVAQAGSEDRHWLPTSSVAAGDTVAAERQDVTLHSASNGVLIIRATSALTCRGTDQFRLEHGQLEVQTGSTETVEVRLPTRGEVIVAPASQARIDATGSGQPPAMQADVQQGKATLRLPDGDHAMAAGDSLCISLDGRKALARLR
ncbi:MAG: protein kinase domain-containing protein [Candidatus Xenobia bacterium]